MDYFPHSLTYRLEPTSVTETLFLSKAKTKKHTIPLMISTQIQGPETLTLKNTLINDISKAIICGSSVYMHIPEIDGYVWTEIQEYAKALKWCIDSGNPTTAIQWLLTEQYQGVYARVFNPETMAIMPEVSPQAFNDELLIATHSRTHSYYAWKFEEGENGVVSWSKDGELSRGVLIDDVVGQYIPATHLAPDVKHTLHQGARLCAAINKVRSIAGIRITSEIADFAPQLDIATLHKPGGTPFKDLAFVAETRRGKYYQLIMQAIPILEQHLTYEGYTAKFFLPVHYWEEILNIIPNVLNESHSSVWSLPYQFSVDGLTTNESGTSVEFKSLPIIENKQIVSYSLEAKWTLTVPDLKIITPVKGKRSKGKLSFTLKTHQEVLSTILAILSQTCTHVKVALAYTTVGNDSQPWLSYYRETVSNVEVLKTGRPLDTNDDIPF